MRMLINVILTENDSWKASEVGKWPKIQARKGPKVCLKFESTIEKLKSQKMSEILFCWKMSWGAKKLENVLIKGKFGNDIEKEESWKV